VGTHINEYLAGIPWRRLRTMSKVIFVNVAIPADKKKRRKEKVHAAFDGSRVFRVKRLTELAGF
jgi:hypothetical protein